jgi:hypothetical protein
LWQQIHGDLSITETEKLLPSEKITDFRSDPSEKITDAYAVTITLTMHFIEMCLL